MIEADLNGQPSVFRVCHHTASTSKGLDSRERAGLRGYRQLASFREALGVARQTSLRSFSKRPTRSRLVAESWPARVFASSGMYSKTMSCLESIGTKLTSGLSCGTLWRRYQRGGLCCFFSSLLPLCSLFVPHFVFFTQCFSALVPSSGFPDPLA